MRKIIFWLCSVLLLFGFYSCSTVKEVTGVEAGKQVSGKFEKTLKINVNYQYLIYFPKDYNTTDKKWPLILFLHGSGERGTDINLVKRNGPPKLVSEGKEFPFIILSPQCPKNISWDNTILMALLNDIISKYKVNENRIYLTGLSSGGSATWSLAIEYPEKFAAIVPISASGEPEDVCALKDVPVWVFHGEKDDVVPIKEDSDMVDALKQCGGNVRFTKYPDVGHWAWVDAYNNPELYEWMLKFSKSDK